MLQFNDITLPCPEGLTLAALLEAQEVDANQIATAVNGEFVPRALRAQTWLAAGDTVLTFQAIVGG
ncbi:MAG: sulfur carrier protein ThiS [Hydrogenophaga sp.]|uniref:sulfur carrier protein ThiS n=1 Tax=Hydrogenophaga sp. TaxID=1904254 RepID=UPI0008B2898A|nr:sulfur carrier protein ThiS [Hydrogenophaga sp.]OGA77017.1 MAG: thiamine biosynthesis protein ThiS [Burkholderiales bacterium GWE1_65_30]OGA90478.1 MAG: thiamine biosynthesis protein ThiS [Burkholderiales bacterium GWF1_66_17]MDO9290386.1 sulfur carrier protein ThiS [Hydrogenophaga sp.]MDP2023409.1 sulfur carrier protein ThiS [Hydrogenophaga sp.]HAX18963.1 thiamine biosynthesis protein ThiS [Hydrogenophaga sp.]